jgi:hypothetical protein
VHRIVAGGLCEVVNANDVCVRRLAEAFTLSEQSILTVLPFGSGFAGCLPHYLHSDLPVNGILALVYVTEVTVADLPAKLEV